MKLYNILKVMRSKNAGPFTLSIDMIFNTAKDFDRVMASPSFAVEHIAALYGIEPSTVTIRPFRKVLAIKVIFPRPVGSGAPGDSDVYGSQQHFPLGSLDV